MLRIIVGLLMILFISGETAADDGIAGVEIPLSITDILKSAVEWAMKIYGQIDAYKNPDKSKQNIETILKQVQEVQNKLETLETHLDMKLDSMLNTLLADIKLEEALNTLKSKIRHSFSKIDNFFNQSQQYKVDTAFAKDSLESFAHKALWQSDSVPDLLDDLHETFIPRGITSSGFLNVMAELSQLNILHDCDTFVSTQQKIYYIYIQLVIAEVKGVVTQQACLVLKRWLNNNKYGAELDLAKTNFQTRMLEYYKLFTTSANNFPAHFRRCEIKAPKHGIDVLEMLKFSRIAVLDSDVVEHESCLACPPKKSLDEAGLKSNTTIYNCRALGHVAKKCAGLPQTSHEYLWWKDESNNRYGPDSKCDKEQPLYGGLVTVPASDGFPDTSILCTACVCSIDMNRNIKNDDSSIWRISVHTQLADIMNDHVVTGIRFITHDNGLHIQIKEARFSVSAMVYNKNQWKDLYQDYFHGRIEPSKMLYESMQHDRKTIYLDDIKAPDGYVVTGVRFQPMGDAAFHLQIFVCPFELSSGFIDPFKCIWTDSSKHPYFPENYKEKRTEIEMKDSDDPTRASEFSYSLASNKMISFTHTDIYKDAGQTTIPLLEASSVETLPAFPLSGVGITFKGRKNYAGYLCLRSYTFNAFQNIILPSFEAKHPPTTTTERVEYEVYSYEGEKQSNDKFSEYSRGGAQVMKV